MTLWWENSAETNKDQMTKVKIMPVVRKINARCLLMYREEHNIVTDNEIYADLKDINLN